MEAGITDWVDYLVIGIYFLLVIFVALLIGASIFASNIGSEHFIGLAGTGAASGIGVVSFEWGAVLLLLLLGWVFLPIYLAADVFTMPEYLGRRFGGSRMRIYLSLVALALYVLTKVSVDMYAGVFFIQLATGINMYLAMIPLLLVTALYTVAGGLAAVVLTDTLQTVVMLFGAVILSIMAFVEVGGMSGLYEKYTEAVSTPHADHDIFNSSLVSNMSGTATPIWADSAYTLVDGVMRNITHCGMPRKDAFHMFRDPITSDLPWPGVVFRATFASLWNWCADQVIVQRALAAKDMKHAQGATILAGYLKFSPLFLIILPGMISRVLYTDEIACIGKEACQAACGNEAGCSNSAYPYLILRLAPVGMRGLLMAVMVAALMSSLTSIFNSAVTVFTMDLWRKGRPQAQDKELIIVGRFFVLVLIGVSIAWIPLIQQSQEGQLFLYIQAVTGYIAPPVSALFLLAIFVPRINEAGAFWGLLCGQLVGVTRLVLDFVYPSPSCGEDDHRPGIVANIHFTYFSIIVFTVTIVVAGVVSLLTPPQPKHQINNLTYWSLRKRMGTRRSESRDVSVQSVSVEDEKPTKGTDHSYPQHLNDWRDSEFLSSLNPKTDQWAWKHALKKFKETGLQREVVQPVETGHGISGYPANGTESIPDKNSPEDESSTASQNITKEMDSEAINPKPKTTFFDPTVEPTWARVLNFNAVVLIVILAFLCGFYH